MNTSTGMFGRGWSSLLDARVAVWSGNAVVVFENNTRIYFDEVSGGWVQSWPNRGPVGTLTYLGAPTYQYAYTTADGGTVRYFDATSGRLVKVTDLASGRELLIVFSNGAPTEVQDSWGTWSYSLDLTQDQQRVEEITFGQDTIQYVYDAQDPSQLNEVHVNDDSWRSYSYNAGGLLTEVQDGQDHVIEQHSYVSGGTYDGWGLSSDTSDESIASITYDADPTQGGYGHRAVDVLDGERAARVVWSSGMLSDYYMRPVPNGPWQVVETRGYCGCGSGGDFVAFAYDGQGRVWRKQDARGFITEWSYDGEARLASVRRGLLPPECSDPDQDADHCRVDTEELAALDLSAQAALAESTYAYGDEDWANKPTSICTPSVVETQQQTCRQFSYDDDSGQVVSEATQGWTWDFDQEESVQQTRTTTKELYDGVEGAAFDPADYHSGAIFDASWLSLEQPSGLLKQVDGPLSGDEDHDQSALVYYPVDSTVPAALRGRLAATRKPAGDPEDPSDDLVVVYNGYDAAGHPTEIIDVAGTVTEMTYDALGRVLQQTLKGQEGCNTGLDPLCATDLVTSYTYEGDTGALEMTTLPSEAVIVNGYDTTWGRLLWTARGPSAQDLRERAHYVYDSYWGKREEEKLEANDSGWTVKKLTLHDYDMSGHLWKTTFCDNGTCDGPATGVEEYAYDPTGNVASVQDPSHEDPNSLYSYDGLGRLVEVQQLETAPDQWVSTSYEYDSHGNLTDVTDPIGVQTTYSVDDFGQAYLTSSREAGESDMSYDPAGRLVWSRDARGATSDRTYDAGGRILSETFTLDTDQESTAFEYDHGRRASATATAVDDTVVSQEFTYDRRGLVVQQVTDIDGAGDTLAVQYSEDGSLSRWSFGAGYTVDIGLDWAGRPTSGLISNATVSPPCEIQVASRIDYLPFGPQSRVIDEDRYSEQLGHDFQYRVTSEQAAGESETTLVDRAFAYGPAGDLTSVADLLDSRFDRTYAYDDLHRVTDATGRFGSLEWTYDSVGNRLFQGVGGVIGDTSYEYEENTSLLSLVSVSDGQGTQDFDILHDAAGNVESDDVSSFVYSPRGKLLQQSAGDVTFSYLYDAAGRRVRTDRPSEWGGTTYHFLLPGGATPYLEEGGRDRVLISIGDRLFAIADSECATIQHVAPDHIGFPLAVISGGDLRWQADGYPFGEIAEVVVGRADDDPLLRYPGQWEVPGLADSGNTRLFYNTHRWYNPAWGRYTQPDPIGLWGGVNLYSYAEQNPFRFIDPEGRETFGIGGSVVNTSSCCVLVSQNNPNGSGQQQYWVPPGGTLIGVWTGIDVDAVYFRDGSGLKIPDGDVAWIFDCGGTLSLDDWAFVPPNSWRPISRMRYKPLPNGEAQSSEFGGPIVPPDNQCCDE